MHLQINGRSLFIQMGAKLAYKYINLSFEDKKPWKMHCISNIYKPWIFKTRKRNFNNLVHIVFNKFALQRANLCKKSLPFKMYLIIFEITWEDMHLYLSPFYIQTFSKSSINLHKYIWFLVSRAYPNSKLVKFV